MLYDQRWDAKTKADPFSLESLIAWLEKQPKNAEYSFISVSNCLLAQYFRSVGYRWVMCGGWLFNHGFMWLRTTRIPSGFGNVSVGSPHTFGAALTRARAVLTERAGA